MTELNQETLDPERQEKAREYAAVRRRFMLLDLALGAGLLILWLVTGWSAALRDWITTWTENRWLAVAAFGGIFGGFFFLVDLPLAYYTGFVLPHRYDQSNQTLQGWITDLLKSTGLAVVLGGLLLEILYYLLQTAPETWWIWTGGVVVLFSAVLANLAPVLIFPLFYDFEPLGEKHQELEQSLLSLAEQAGTEVRGVYTFDISRRTKSANAGLTGLGSSQRIIVGDNLLEEFTNPEIETVLAHELGHQVHHDIVLGMAFQAVLNFGGLYLASLALRWGVEAFDFRGIADLAALPLFGLVLGAFGLVTMPLSNAYSRWRERMADRYALQATGKGEAYASALTRLANQNLAEVDPDRWVEVLLYSHPPLKKRIALAQSGRSHKD